MHAHTNHSVTILFSVPVPFKGDRLNLRDDERWAQLVAKTNEQRVVWADTVHKINRTDMKVPYICVCTCKDLQVHIYNG